YGQSRCSWQPRVAVSPDRVGGSYGAATVGGPSGGLSRPDRRQPGGGNPPPGVAAHRRVWRRTAGSDERRGCCSHVVTGSCHKLTRGFLISGRLPWYGRCDRDAGDAGGEVRGDLAAPGWAAAAAVPGVGGPGAGPWRDPAGRRRGGGPGGDGVGGRGGAGGGGGAAGPGPASGRGPQAAGRD